MTKMTPVAILCALGAVSAPLFAGSTGGGGSDIHGIAEREIVRRQEAMTRAQSFIEAGDKAMSERDYEEATSQYRGAVDALPEAEATARLRKDAVSKFTDAALKLAEQRIAEGRYQDARNLCDLVLRPEYNPDSKGAIRLLARLEDPEYYNQTITPGFVAKVEDVKKLLLEAQGFYDTGRYDMAMKRYDQVLNIDPYNIAARKGQERVNQARDNYAVEAYNETRSRAIWQVDNAWQSPVRKFQSKDTAVYEQNKVDVRGTAYVENKLARIMINRIDLKDATVREAIEFLKQKAREADTVEPDPTKRGVNIVLKLDSAAPVPSVPAADTGGIPGLPAADSGLGGASIFNPSDIRITLALNNVPLGEVLRYVAGQANLKVKVDPFAVNIVPMSDPTDTMLTKEYRVPPGFIGRTPGAAGGAAPASPFGGGGTAAADATRGGSALGGRAGAREYLEGQGVTFPPGASANYLASSSKLVVRNTQENLDLIDTLVDAAVGAAPTQVEIESKFVEITQNNLKELSFDWLLGQFNVPGNSSVFAGGGTPGTAAGLNNADYPFVPPGAQAPVGQNPITAGNRSGALGISANAIDALLFGFEGASLKAPGVLGIAGVFTDPQFQLVIRALNQKKGVDLLSAPRVTTKSGQRAVIEIIREFRYPTEFDPPEIPQDFGGGGSSSIGGASTIAVFPVTPTTPTTFETRNTGVTLEVEPLVGPDGYTIELNLVPQVVEFEGFINYGSPIRTVNPASFGIGGGLGQAVGVPSSIVLTENVINQPIFSTRKVTTSVSIWDGQTVVLGGLMREDVQKVEDKVPLLGDIPVVGRLFRSDVDQHLKRNLVIFVTARLINPAGEPVVAVDEEEESVEPLPLPEAPAGFPPAEASGYYK